MQVSLCGHKVKIVETVDEDSITHLVTCELFNEQHNKLRYMNFEFLFPPGAQQFSKTVGDRDDFIVNTS